MNRTELKAYARHIAKELETKQYVVCKALPQSKIKLLLLYVQSVLNEQVCYFDNVISVVKESVQV